MNDQVVRTIMTVTGDTDEKSALELNIFTTYKEIS